MSPRYDVSHVPTGASMATRRVSAGRQSYIWPIMEFLHTFYCIWTVDQRAIYCDISEKSYVKFYDTQLKLHSIL